MIDDAERIVRMAGATAFVFALAGSGLSAAFGRARRARGRSSGLARWLGAIGTFTLGAAVYAAICVLLWRRIPFDLPGPARVAALAAGGLAGTSGLVLYLAGRRALDDMYNVSSALGSELYAGHRLVTAGPYRIVRHPMYLGIALGAAGAVLVYRTWTTVFMGASLVATAAKARREDRLLAAEFGEAFEKYRRDVPGFIPRLRIRRRGSHGGA